MLNNFYKNIVSNILYINEKITKICLDENINLVKIHIYY